MRKVAIIVSILAALGLGTALYLRSGNAADGGTATNGSGRPGGTGAFARPPMTVELTRAKTGSVSDRIMIVGNLIGSATVDVVPKVSGRLQSVAVRLGDPVRKGQLIAKVEDREIQEQVKQVEASFEVARATIRQREADLKFAETNVERSRSLFDRELLAKQTLDDAEARRPVGGGAARSGARAVRAGEGAARRAEDQPGEHPDSVAGRWLRRQAQPRPGGLRGGPALRSPRWSTSAWCGSSSISSKRT